MFRNRIRFPVLLQVLAAWIAVLLAVPAFAQTTGSIEVAVIDGEGLSVPGATVTVRGSQGDQSRPADSNGEVTFSSLDPGTYDVTAAKEGIGSNTTTGVQVLVGRTTMVEISLATAEEITVEAQREAIDVADTSTSTVLSKDFLNRLPTNRSYQGVVGLAEGVVGQGGNRSIGGGATNENTYLLDGANITDPVTGTFSVNFNFDAIEQIEVLLGGYMPEYPTSLGGIVNIVTENGTNNLEFAASIFYNNGNWSPKMDERITADGLLLGPTAFDSEFQSLQVTSKIAGPLVRDKAFFILSYQHDRSIQANTGVPQTRDYDAHYILSKLTVQPTTEHRLSGLLQLDPTTIDNLDQGDVYQKAESQLRQAQGGFLSQGKWTWFFTPDVNLETGFNVQKTYIEQNGVPCTHNEKFNYHPCEPDEPEGYVDWETPGRIGLNGAFDSVNHYRFYFDDRWRYQASSKLSLVSVKDPWGGKHDIKVGISGDQLVWDQIQGFSGNMYFVDLNEVPFDPQTLNSYYWIELSGPIKFRTTGSQWAAYVQDSWKPVSNLTVNYGTRFDNFVMRNDIGEPVLTGNLLGPRLYAAWDPWSDQRTKIATGYGRFNDIGRLGVAAYLSQANYATHIYVGELFGEYPLGVLNNTAADYETLPVTNFATVAPNLRSPYVAEIILNVERVLVENLALRNHLTGRFTRNQYTQEDLNLIYDSDGSAGIGSRSGNASRTLDRLRTPALAKRDYFRWDVILHKIKADRWEAQATYSYTTSIGSTISALDGNFLIDPQTQYNYGPLNTDLRHVVKSYGYWDMPTDPWTATLGATVEYYGGMPEERLYSAENQYGQQFESFSLRIQPRGTYLRLDPFWSTGLRYLQSIDVRKGRLQVDVSATNLTNNRAADDWDYAYLDQYNRLLISSRQSPLQVQAGLRYEF